MIIQDLPAMNMAGSMYQMEQSTGVIQVLQVMNMAGSM